MGRKNLICRKSTNICVSEKKCAQTLISDNVIKMLIYFPFRWVRELSEDQSKLSLSLKSRVRSVDPSAISKFYEEREKMIRTVETLFNDLRKKGRISEALKSVKSNRLETSNAFAQLKLSLEDSIFFMSKMYMSVKKEESHVVDKKKMEFYKRELFKKELHANEMPKDNTLLQFVIRKLLFLHCRDIGEQHTTNRIIHKIMVETYVLKSGTSSPLVKRRIDNLVDTLSLAREFKKRNQAVITTIRTIKKREERSRMCGKIFDILDTLNRYGSELVIQEAKKLKEALLEWLKNWNDNTLIIAIEAHDMSGKILKPIFDSIYPNFFEAPLPRKPAHITKEELKKQSDELCKFNLMLKHYGLEKSLFYMFKFILKLELFENQFPKLYSCLIADRKYECDLRLCVWAWDKIFELKDRQKSKEDVSDTTDYKRETFFLATRVYTILKLLKKRVNRYNLNTRLHF